MPSRPPSALPKLQDAASATIGIADVRLRRKSKRHRWFINLVGFCQYPSICCFWSLNVVGVVNFVGSTCGALSIASFETFSTKVSRSPVILNFMNGTAMCFSPMPRKPPRATIKYASLLFDGSRRYRSRSRAHLLSINNLGSNEIPRSQDGPTAQLVDRLGVGDLLFPPRTGVS